MGDLESFYKLFNGLENIAGTNTEYIKSQISELKSRERTEDEEEKLIRYYNELGCDNKGNKKPKVCWDYIRKGGCNHIKRSELERGMVINNLWHPNKEEKEYLHKKSVY